jgi:DNA-binding response OmpR family regulator/chromosome segregation ATPase
MSQRILLFESDDAFAAEVRSNFEALGLTVDVAADGEQGLDIAAANRPDLILLTIELPRMNGFLVCKKIKKQENLQNVPLLILSSEATQDVFEQHKKLRTRAEDYIHKPIAFADLLERAQRFVNIRANGSAPPERATDAAIEITDLDESEMILEAEQDEEASTQAAAFADEAVNAVTSSKAPAAYESEPPAAAPEPAPVMARAAVEPVTTVSSVDSSTAEELVRVQEELRRSAARVAELEAEVSQLERRAGDAEQEAQNAKQRASNSEKSLSEASKKGGASSRELLDLREQLNRKDRELLGLRDQVTSRDRQLVEGSDRTLELERQAADLADRHADGQRELEKAKEDIAALQSDRDAARKRFEDAKMRLERSEQKVRELGDEMGAIKATHARELEAANRRHAEREAETAALHQQALDRHKAEAAAQLAAELAQKREEAERHRLTALADLRNTLEADSAQRLADAQAKHDALISQVMAAHSNELSNTRKGLEEKHESELRQINERSQQELSRVGRALAETETRIQLLQDQLEEAESARSDLSTRLARTTAERDQKTELSEELQAQLSRLAALRGEEEHVLERARKAFAIGLSLLEDHRRGSS